ncbi:MAG: amino acid ABC transporter permease [Thermoleophilia bacterium]|nr:amino acid ABC transporter permease [Thermoleophilia bacterium]MDH4338908.1 amino acid ABC transporter permease [Thermoleophilia bacterium]MDH5281274.1 amino acid ABC transporter permease [Thermoleophilia bacterium]
MPTSFEGGGGSLSLPPAPRARHRSRRERLELFSARVPFRLKLVVVWATILVLLVSLFAAADFDVAWMREHAAFIVKGITWTIVIAVLSILLACTLALLGALGRLSRNAIAVGVSGFYVSFFRGTPLIVQLFLIYLALPQIGIALGDPWADILTLDVLTAGVLALGLNYGAYMTEIFRAGIQSVGHGQSEAAEALGMTYSQKMRRVVLPQGLRVIVPPTGNEFIAMMKDTALVSFLGASIDQMEIFRRAQLVGKADFRNLEALLIAALVYWALTTIFQYFQLRLERRLSRGHVRGTAGVAVQGQSRMASMSG